MSVEKLQQDILFCKQTVRNLILKHYDQDRYATMIDIIFKDIFQDYLKESGKAAGIENQCPNKLEPLAGHLPEKSLKKIKKAQGLE